MLLNIPILMSKEVKRMIGKAISKNRRYLVFYYSNTVLGSDFIILKKFKIWVTNVCWSISIVEIDINNANLNHLRYPLGNAWHYAFFNLVFKCRKDNELKYSTHSEKVIINHLSLNFIYRKWILTRVESQSFTKMREVST